MQEFVISLMHTSKVIPVYHYDTKELGKETTKQCIQISSEIMNGYEISSLISVNEIRFYFVIANFQLNN